METTPAIVGIVLTVIALSAYQGKEEKVAQQKHEQGMKNLSVRNRSVYTWLPPELSIKKTDKETGQESSK